MLKLVHSFWVSTLKIHRTEIGEITDIVEKEEGKIEKADKEKTFKCFRKKTIISNEHTHMMPVQIWNFTDKRIKNLNTKTTLKTGMPNRE